MEPAQLLKIKFKNKQLQLYLNITGYIIIKITQIIHSKMKIIFEIAAYISLELTKKWPIIVLRQIVSGHLSKIGLIVHCHVKIQLISTKNIAVRQAIANDHVGLSDATRRKIYFQR